eukprot:Phypoly_transcript_19309.p1 GENE.Phypoly_transcript_19309~~Phypoly_transcript_19309.p1  ORF type:complete len:237 (+),score=25.77 Phypoly_transcript_19309:29-712(+)
MRIRPLTFSEIPKAVEICVNSFIENDHLIQYTYGSATPKNKRELVTHLYTNYFTQTNRFNHHIYLSDSTNEDELHTNHMRSVALVLPPNTPWPMDAWGPFAIEHKELISKLGNKTIDQRFDTLEAWFDDQREDLQQEKAYYLAILATDENYRKKGYASRIIKHVTDMADRDNAPVYLECTEIENVPFYEAKGFRIISKDSPPKDATNENSEEEAVIWYMVREPIQQQ